MRRYCHDHCRKRLLGFILIFLLLLNLGGASAQVTDTIRSMVRAVNSGIPPKEKLNYLYKICAAYWYVNVDSAFYYGWQGLDLTDKDVNPGDVGKLYFTLARTWDNQGNFDSAQWYFNQARNIFKQHSLDRLYYRTVEQLGNTYRVTGQFDTARILITEALNHWKRTNDTLQLSSALFNLGTSWLDQNRYTRALKYYLQAIAFDSVLKDTSTIALNSLGVGNVYLNLGSLFREINPSRSNAYFKQSIAYFKRSHILFSRIGHSMGVCYALMNLQAAYLNSGYINLADSIGQEANSCRDDNNSRLTMDFLYYEAAIKSAKGNPKEALRLLDTVAGMRSQLLLLNDFYEAMILRAKLLHNTGQTQMAFSQLKEVTDWATVHRVYQVAFPALKTLASWHSANGESILAYSYLLTAQAYKDSLYNEVSNELFDEVEVKHEKEALVGELASLRSEHKLSHLRNLVIILILSTLVLFTLGLIVIINIRRKQILAKEQAGKEKILRMQQEAMFHQSEVERLNLERALHQEEADRLQLQLQIKEHELIYQSLRQTDLKQLNLSIREKMAPFLYRLPKKKDQEEFVSLVNELTRDASRDPMDDFEILFRQMHGGFFEKLLERGPDLSRSELRTCALLRLNLPTKEIARLLNLSSASVDATRHHIRKKLNLDPKENLTSFLIMV
jgi:tetratricopeptide (TPR) repeat protein